jgi:hypothetical protein
MDNYNNDGMFDLIPEDEKKRKMAEIVNFSFNQPEEESVVSPYELSEVSESSYAPAAPKKTFTAPSVVKPRSIAREVTKAAKDVGVELPPEIKKEVVNRWQSYDDDIKSANSKADRNAKLMGIMEGLSTIATAGTGVKPDTSFYRGIVDREDSKVGRSKEAKLEAIRDYQMRKGEEDAASKLGREIAKDNMEQYRWEEGNKLRISENEKDRESRKIETQAAKAERAANKQEDRDYRKELLNQELEVTPGVFAKTKDDAKKLKDAAVAKDQFANAMNQMIALRKKHGGGAVLNREDVAVGKQLATEAQIAWKTMASLGVLSASDIKMMNDVIPQDPLEYNFSGIAGMDPTQARLESGLIKTVDDYAAQVKNRTVGGSNYGKQNEGQLPSSNEGKQPQTRRILTVDDL